MRILRFWQFNRPWRTEIPDEPVQGIIALQVFAVMVSWDGEDWSMIKFIRLVELFIIFQYLTIEIYAISGNIEKRWVFTCVLCTIEIVLHAFGDKLLRDSVFNATHITV